MSEKHIVARLKAGRIGRKSLLKNLNICSVFRHFLVVVWNRGLLDPSSRTGAPKLVLHTHSLSGTAYSPFPPQATRLPVRPLFIVATKA